MYFIYHCVLLLFLSNTRAYLNAPELVTIHESFTSNSVKEKRAIYKSCDLQTVSVNGLFVDSITLDYLITKDSGRIKELKFRTPIPPQAIIQKYEVKIGTKIKFESKAYPKFLAEEIYDNTTETETCGKVQLIQDVFDFSLKISNEIQQETNVSIVIHWQSKPHISYNGSELVYTYIFPRKSYYKYKSDIDRSVSSFIVNQHGICDFSARLNFRGYEIVKKPTDFNKNSDDSNVYDFDADEDEKEGNIIFELKPLKTENIQATRFTFDGCNVIELSMLPSPSKITAAIDSEREIIFVVDKSGSMSWGSDGVIPFRVIQKTVEYIVSACADMPVHINFVPFDHKIDENRDVLFTESTLISNSGNTNSRWDIKKIKEYVLDALQPNGGTDIHNALSFALKTKRIIKDGKCILRNIVLLTDGGDFNVERIKELVSTSAKDDIRFFAVGIGNGVSFDTIKTVADNGNGSCDYIWNCKKVGEVLMEVIKRTGMEKFNFESFVNDDYVCNHIENGKLIPNFDSLQLPNKKNITSFFPNEHKNVYLIYKEEIPAQIKFKLGSEEIVIKSEEIKTPEDSLIISNLQRELAKQIEEEFAIVINMRIEKEHPEVFQEISLGHVSERHSVMFEKDIHLKNLVINRLDSNLKNDLLAQGTELMIGDNLRGLDTWKEDKDLNKKLLSQFAILGYSSPEQSFYKYHNYYPHGHGRQCLSSYMTLPDLVESDSVDSDVSFDCLSSDGPKLTSISSRKSFGSHSASSAVSSSKKPTGMNKFKTSSQNSENEDSGDLFDKALKILEEKYDIIVFCDEILALFTEEYFESYHDQVKKMINEVMKLDYLNEIGKKNMIFGNIFTNIIRVNKKEQEFVVLTRLKSVRATA